LLDDKPIGAALNRNLGSPTAPGEAVESELDRLITRRHDARVSSEGERQAEEMWQESVKRYEEKRRQIARAEWHLHHTAQAERLRRTLEALASHHEEQAAKLMEATHERSLG
jgi:ABC-type phosphonate transport system ATPase subunit